MDTVDNTAGASDDQGAAGESSLPVGSIEGGSPELAGGPSSFGYSESKTASVDPDLTWKQGEMAMGRFPFKGLVGVVIAVIGVGIIWWWQTGQPADDRAGDAAVSELETGSEDEPVAEDLGPGTEVVANPPEFPARQIDEGEFRTSQVSPPDFNQPVTSGIPQEEPPPLEGPAEFPSERTANSAFPVDGTGEGRKSLGFEPRPDVSRDSGLPIAEGEGSVGRLPDATTESLSDADAVPPQPLEFRPPNDSLELADTEGDVHVVRPGESYWTISRTFFGSARYFQALASYNRQRIPDPRKMKPGMKVVVPSKTLLETRFGELIPQFRLSAEQTNVPAGFFIDADGQPMFRVGSDDTLTNISQRLLGRSTRWIQIYQLNRGALPNPDKLKPGAILRLPADAARVELLPERRPNR